MPGGSLKCELGAGLVSGPQTHLRAMCLYTSLPGPSSRWEKIIFFGVYLAGKLPPV